MVRQQLSCAAGKCQVALLLAAACVLAPSGGCLGDAELLAGRAAAESSMCDAHLKPSTLLSLPVTTKPWLASGGTARWKSPERTMVLRKAC
jgi:hypothetical protein